jgi:replication-associated recombination protein RarA
MAKKIEYASFKKLLIFGTKGVGKTSLAKTFDENIINEDIEASTNSKKINKINFILLFI